MDAEDVHYDFEDDRAQLDRDANVRRRYLRWFNKRREDFSSDRQYDDYLEMVEDIVYNLVNNVDVEQTKHKIDTYRRENQDSIALNEVKNADEIREEREQITQAERDRISKLAELRKQDQEEERRRLLKRRQEEAEELLRIAKGDDALEKLKKKREKKERKRKRMEARAAKAAEQAAIKRNPEVMVMGINFPHPPPAPIWGEKKPMLQAQPASEHNSELQVKAAKAAGFRQQLVYQRALDEFTQSLSCLQLEPS